jgi:M6 family metalloprotease-like protein
MNPTKTFVIIVLFFFFISDEVYSVPAYPCFIQIQQPNGEEITVKMRGDERMKWMESEDGYSLLYGENKYIVYAVNNNKGDMTPSSVIAQNVGLRSDKAAKWLKTVPKNLHFSAGQKEILQQLWTATRKKSLYSSVSSKTATGTAKAVCALIQFPDRALNYTNDDFAQLMNQVGYVNGAQQGSVRDFYLENSYGQLDMIVTVVGPYTVSHNMVYYGENDGPGSIDARADELAKEAAVFAFKDPAVRPEDYDNDGDGYIDAFHFIFAGYGEESGAGDNYIWSHMSEYWPMLTFGNKRLRTYSCSPELRGRSGTNMTYSGVICHELCHIFGSPDYYDTDGGDSGGLFPGTGKWDLMADGSWNNEGATPAHINMFQKIMFGWVNPVELSSSQKVTDMPNSAETPFAYVIKTGNPDEYYILENRQKTGFDAKIPGTGLLIYHANYNARRFADNLVNVGHPQGLYPVYAASTYSEPTGTVASYGSINTSTCTFPLTGIVARHDFTDETTPSAFLWSGGKLGKPITNITEKNQLISFNFMPREYSLNLQAEVTGNQVNLSWKKPYSGKEIKGYNVYRNGVLIMQTSNTVFQEKITQKGSYTYGVSIQFEEEESPAEEIVVELNGTSIEGIYQYSSFIYPNPVESNASFDLFLGDNTCPAEVLFYTLSGQLVLQKRVEATRNRFPAHLPAGIYMVKIKQGLQVSMQRLMVK